MDRDSSTPQGVVFAKFRADGCVVQIYADLPGEEGNGWDDYRLCHSPGEARATAELLNSVTGEP
jgi:hypothetical protein